MINFRKDPKSKDLEYIEEIYSIFFEAYGRQVKVNFHELIKPEIKSFHELKEFLSLLCNELNIKASMKISNENGEYIFELPRTYFYDEVNDEIVLSITDFGVLNPEITVVEVLLFLIGVKIFKDGLISVTDDIYEDLENSYRPFLVCTAIFFGFGNFLLARNIISGGYYDETDEMFLKYTYRVPLDLSTMIYANSIIIAHQKQFFNNSSNSIHFLSNEIKKELQICLRYLNLGKSNFYNNLILEK